MATHALSTRAAEALTRSKNAAQGALRRVREREKNLKEAAAGAGAAYFAAPWWAERRAEEAKGGDKAALELGPVELDGTKLGASAAIAGAMGITGDDVYDAALYGAGLAVISADRAIDAYTTALAEPPSE